MTRLERMSRAAIERFPAVAQRLKEAAEESLQAAKSSRAKVRRQRIVSQTLSAVKEEPLDMPLEWREDEDTVKTTIPDDIRKPATSG